jgi:hypothetical protein
MMGGENGTGYKYITNRLCGAEVSGDKLIHTPTGTSSSNYQNDVSHTANGAVGTRIFTYSGMVDIPGGNTFPLDNVNYFVFSDRIGMTALEGQLVMFNNMSNSYPTDSAFVWSPYTSTIVRLSYPEGRWCVNELMELTVQSIVGNVTAKIPAASPYGGLDFNGDGIILVGNGSGSNSSKTFLSTLKAGDKVGIPTTVNVNGVSVSDKKVHLLSIDYRKNGTILSNGSTINTWNEAEPYTAVGYSANQKKVYLITVDRRSENVSAGVTTEEWGYILKAAGADYTTNLDGGGSTTMVVNGSMVNCLITGLSERAVANGLIALVPK